MVPDLLERIDAAIRALQALRDEMASAMPTPSAEGSSLDADDWADSNLLGTTLAAERFNYDRHTIARWCKAEGLGIRNGGRWLVSIPRLQRRLNGG